MRRGVTWFQLLAEELEERDEVPIVLWALKVAEPGVALHIHRVHQPLTAARAGEDLW